MSDRMLLKSYLRNSVTAIEILKQSMLKDKILDDEWRQYSVRAGDHVTFVYGNIVSQQIVVANFSINLSNFY